METESHSNKTGTGAYRAMLGVAKTLMNCSIEKELQELIELRVSQINGCAFCIDMHWKEARAAGETEQRLYGLSAWQESPYYSERERAALLFAEELTQVAHRTVSEDVHHATRTAFSEQELADLVWVISSINTWNRVNIGLRTVPGNYRPMAAAQQS